jgi:hypothetical protein
MRQSRHLADELTADLVAKPRSKPGTKPDSIHMPGSKPEAKPDSRPNSKPNLSTSESDNQSPTERGKQTGTQPSLRVVLTPHGLASSPGAIEYMRVTYELQEPRIGRGEVLAKIHLVTASIPVCEFGEEGLSASDNLGELPLYVCEGPGDYGPARFWRVERPTDGDVRLTYRVFPRVLPEGYRASPYFDLRNEDGGVNGAGVTFMVLPPDKPYRLSVHWNLSEMPEGCRGIWCMGEGDVTVVEQSRLLAFSYYAAGFVKEYRDAGDDKFAMYWLSKPAFDTEAVARRIRDLFKYMSAFFGDEDAPYKVFVRKDPFEKSGGGTALRDSFMFGWSEATKPTPDSLQNLLAHEMVHNWPHTEGEEANCTWYNEGTAEYYSIVLPFRAGISSVDDVLAQLAKRTERYYGNPLRELSNSEACEIYWKDRNAQRLPYGRGFFYLVDTDCRIREASGGKRSVDDVVLEMLRRRRAKEPHGLDVWLDLVSRETGVDEGPVFEAIARGQLILPRDEWFGSAFRAVKATLTDENGYASDSYRWEMNPLVPKESVML